jgi:hypothetical protein
MPHASLDSRAEFLRFPQPGLNTSTFSYRRPPPRGFRKSCEGAVPAMHRRAARPCTNIGTRRRRCCTRPCRQMQKSLADIEADGGEIPAFVRDEFRSTEMPTNDDALLFLLNGHRRILLRSGDYDV